MEPIIFGSQTPQWLEFLQGFGPFIAVGLTAFITWKLALRRIDAEFDLKREEIKIYKERSLVELKIILLKDIEEASKKYSVDEIISGNMNERLISCRNRAISYLKGTKINEILQEGVEACDKLEKMFEDPKGKFDLDQEKKDLLTSIVVILDLAHQRIAGDLGFGGINKLKVSDIKKEVNAMK